MWEKVHLKFSVWTCEEKKEKHYFFFLFVAKIVTGIAEKVYIFVLFQNGVIMAKVCLLSISTWIKLQYYNFTLNICTNDIYCVF